MTTVSIGSNVFENCEAILGFGNVIGLRVETNPLRVTLNTPKHPKTGLQLSVDRNVGSEGLVSIVASDRSVGIFYQKQPLVLATEIGGDAVNVRLDLRAAGLNIFDDGTDLRIGSNRFSGNYFADSQTAIQLG